MTLKKTKRFWHVTGSGEFASQFPAQWPICGAVFWLKHTLINSLSILPTFVSLDYAKAASLISHLSWGKTAWFRESVMKAVSHLSGVVCMCSFLYTLQELAKHHYALSWIQCEARLRFGCQRTCALIGAIPQACITCVNMWYKWWHVWKKGHGHSVLDSNTLRNIKEDLLRWEIFLNWQHYF